MASRQLRVLYTVLGTVAVIALGAWAAGSRIESPAEVAARTAPPAPSPILVPVEERVLSSEVVTRGTIRFGLPQPVSIAPSVLKGNPGLIASLPVRSAQFREGDVMLTASGRPAFILQGPLPAYRDLGPGVSGEDVRQMEQALARLGFDPGVVDDIYDQQTGAAVARLYKAKGWEPFGPTREQLAGVRAIEREWRDAMKTKLAASAAAAVAVQAVESARAIAEQNVRAAAVELAARTQDRRKLIEARAMGESLTVEAERARAEHANAAATADLTAQTADVALITLDPRQPQSTRNAAQARLELARAARGKIKLEGELAIEVAKQDLLVAAERVKLAEAAGNAARLEGERAIQAAVDAQMLAEFDAKIALERLNLLTSDLEAAKRKLGVQVPVDEIVFINTLPVRVEEVKAAVGGAASGIVMTVTDNLLSVDSSLPLDVAPLVKPGMRVAIDEQALGISASGVVQTVASTPGTRGVDGFHIYLGVRVDETPIRLEGYSVRLTIPIKSTAGAVTAVPVSALSLAADGTSRVHAEKSGTFEYITVRPGMSAGGYVEVTPVEGTLRAGQSVVVGYKNVEPRDTK
jgi:peptidoglycan hydrolase-like protein with peptidoglycan-binding domain